ncbi:hypothetical protein YC2023_086925 [Brassica napus]
MGFLTLLFQSQKQCFLRELRSVITAKDSRFSISETNLETIAFISARFSSLSDNISSRPLEISPSSQLASKCHHLLVRRLADRICTLTPRNLICKKLNFFTSF